MNRNFHESLAGTIGKKDKARGVGTYIRYRTQHTRERERKELEQNNNYKNLNLMSLFKFNGMAITAHRPRDHPFKKEYE